MTEKIKHLNLPLGEKEARELRVGDMVTVSGKLFTGRSRFHIRAIAEDILPPIDFSQVNCFFHSGPVMRQTEAGWEIVSIEPTSSIRFERYGAEVIRKLKLRTLIGKTTMGRRSAEALAEVGGVFLSKIGVCGNSIAEQVKKVHGVYFAEELGKTEATWLFEVEEFGPFFVAIDALANSYFENRDGAIRQKLAQVESDLGIRPDYRYTVVGPTGSNE